MWYNFYRPGCSKTCQTPIGNNRIICLFDRPTKLEAGKKMPVMGLTGSNLCLLFRILRTTPSLLKDEYGVDLYRRQVGIFNTADENKHSICLDGKLKDTEDKLVLCFGEEAEKRVRKYSLRNQICVYHTGEEGLMNIGCHDEVCEHLKIPVAMRSVARLFVVAEYIIRRYVEIVKGVAAIGSFPDFLSRFNTADREEFSNLLSNVNGNCCKVVFSSECSFNCCKKCKQCKLIGGDFVSCHS